MLQSIRQLFQSDSRNRVALLALLLALLLLNLPSSGFVRYGPGADDEGSGLGGTGRTPVPGSDSGLGGTGFRPFVGYTSSEADGSSAARSALSKGDPAVTVYRQPTERNLAISSSVVLDIPTQRPVSSAPLPSPRETLHADDYTRDSSAILITEHIQQEIDNNALIFAQLDAQSDIDTGDAPHKDTVTPEQSASPFTAVEEANTETPRNEGVSWLALSSYLTEQQDSPSKDSSDSALAALANDRNDIDRRMQRPDRVQRPQLPPMQRVRPVQRAGVLPPRIKPLKL